MAVKQYEQARVRQLIRSTETYNGWRVNTRAPQVGDVGTVVDILSAPGLPDNYVVECSAPDGRTLWLGDFTAEELEPLAQTL